MSTLSSVLAPSSDGIGSFLFLVVRPGDPSSVLAPNSDGLQPSSLNHPQSMSEHSRGCQSRRTQSMDLCWA